MLASVDPANYLGVESLEAGIIPQCHFDNQAIVSSLRFTKSSLRNPCAFDNISQHCMGINDISPHQILERHESCQRIAKNRDHRSVQPLYSTDRVLLTPCNKTAKDFSHSIKRAIVTVLITQNLVLAALCVDGRYSILSIVPVMIKSPACG